MKSTFSPLVLVMALAAPGALAADDTYRSVMPDGSVRYGEKPEQGAKSVRRLPPPPASTGVITVTPQEQARPIDTREPAGAAVIDPPKREPPQASEPGRLQAPAGLPRRSY